MANVDQRFPTVGMHVPVVMTDGAAWVSHDQACQVCHHRRAIMVMHTGVFLPCGPCQASGWNLRRRKVRLHGFWHRVWGWHRHDPWA